MESEDLLLDISENLETLEDTLLGAEQKLQRGEDVSSLVQFLFRNAHNSKGAFGILQIEEPQFLLHQFETCLDRVRNGKGVLTERLLDRGLATVSLLLRYLDGDNDAEGIAAVAGELESMASAMTANNLSREISWELSREEESRLAEAAEKGWSLYMIEKLVEGGVSEELFLSLPIFSDVNDVGALIGFRPDTPPEDLQDGTFLLELVFATELPEDELEYQIFDTYFSVSAPVASEMAVLPEKAEVKEVAKDRKRILIVDDDELNRMVAEKILSSYGETKFAVDGRDGLIEYLVSLEEGNPFDLVFLDISMPNLDGHALLRYLRKTESERDVMFGRGTPVVMCSSHGESSHILGAFKESCDGYLVKPIDRSKLNELFRKIGLSPEQGQAA